MDPLTITKQMISFQKSTFDNTFNAMVLIQDQTERMARTFLTKASWLPEEGKQAIDDWIKTYKKGRDEFKNAVDTSYSQVETAFKKPEAEAAPAE